MCSLCQRPYPDQSQHSYFLDSISDTGTKWPDFIMTASTFFDCVTEHVVKGLTSHGAKGWEAIPVKIPNRTLAGEHMDAHIHKNTRSGQKLPNLFILHSAHWGRLDLQSSGLGDCTFCAECGKAVSNFKEPDQLVIDQSTFDWDASDFFHFTPWGQPRLFVTRRIIEIARVERWTGVYFEPLGVPYNLMSRFRNRINPLDTQWPPTHHWE